jgi:hypothetical protein
MQQTSKQRNLNRSSELRNTDPSHASSFGASPDKHNFQRRWQWVDNELMRYSLASQELRVSERMGYKEPVGHPGT